MIYGCGPYKASDIWTMALIRHVNVDTWTVALSMAMTRFFFFCSHSGPLH